MTDIRINFRASEEDFTRFTRVATAHLCTRNIVVWVLSFAFSLVATYLFSKFIVHLFSEQIPEGVETIGESVCFLVLYFLLYIFFQQQMPLEYLHPQGSFLRPKETKIDEEGIRETSDVSTAFTQWSGVIDIEENDFLILIYVDQMAAYVIPKSTFLSPEDAKTFVSQARGFWEVAKARTSNEDNQSKSPWGIPRVAAVQVPDEKEEKKP